MFATSHLNWEQQQPIKCQPIPFKYRTDRLGFISESDDVFVMDDFGILIQVKDIKWISN